MLHVRDSGSNVTYPSALSVYLIPQKCSAEQAPAQPCYERSSRKSFQIPVDAGQTSENEWRAVVLPQNCNWLDAPCGKYRDICA